jgi:predicted alpha/beta superfamily hydrolase
MSQGTADTGTAAGGAVGDIRILAGVFSPELANARDVQVYLPASYERSGRHYPVIYMHDGQNLFDTAASFAGEWGVDDTLERLGPEGVEVIIVAVPNMGERRIDEYSPFRDPRKGGGRGEAYLQFLVRTLKPAVDQQFRTRHEPTHTGLMGSSLGGLISLYGFLHYPGVFGFAGVMSPALWFADRAIFEDAALRGPWTGKIYLDIGTSEGRPAVRDARQMARVLRRTTARPRLNLMYVEGRGAGHHESAWAGRFERAIRFLLPRAPEDLHW